MSKVLLIILMSCFSFSILAIENAAQIFERYNFSTSEIEDIFFNYPELKDVKVAFEKSLETSANQITLKLYSENSNYIYTINKSDTLIDIKVDEANYQLEKKLFEGQIVGDLYESILNDTQNVKMAQVMSNAFKDDFINTKGLKIGANYSFEIENFYENDQLIKAGDIVSANIIVGRAVVEKKCIDDDRLQHCILKKLIPDEAERIFESPVDSKRITSTFNLSRRHPVKRRRIQPHNGVDFSAKSGTPVHPALDGEIISIGRARAKGKFVLIRHSNGFESTYDHLRKFKKGLRVGMHVTINDLIGEVGRTGYATGAHLHFGILKNGLYVNPIDYLNNYQIDKENDPAIDESDDQ